MHRLTLEFPHKTHRILTDLAKKDHTTMVNILRRALALYNYVHDEVVMRRNERKLSITDDQDKILKDIVF